MKSLFQSTCAAIAHFQTDFLFRIEAPSIKVPLLVSPSKNPYEVI